MDGRRRRTGPRLADDDRRVVLLGITDRHRTRGCSFIGVTGPFELIRCDGGTVLHTRSVTVR